jgi:hypothetical protein
MALKSQRILSTVALLGGITCLLLAVSGTPVEKILYTGVGVLGIIAGITGYRWSKK